ncbi:NAD(P)/FAD-dependent oxidoreductase [Chryseolinea sp. T2]|uniref:flavin monoamine oxidase family protein n=1 Tax=Chryseolinea sp. T2 TaxID=3129255 RepID=UPI003077688B
MNRRELLKNLGFGLSASLVLPPLLSSCQDEDPAPKIDYEGTVAIVGAGAAGLYAADILKAQGIKVVIFEASDRIGGRVRSLKSTDKATQSLIFTSSTEIGSDFPNELGASVVLGADSAWGRFVEQLKISTVNVTNSATENYVVNNAFVSGADIASDADFIAAKNFYDNLASQTGTATVQAAIESAGINSRMHAILNAWIGNKYSTSNDRLSMQQLADSISKRNRGNESLTLMDNPMQDALLSRFSKVATDVHTNHQVKRINYSGATVAIEGVNSVTGESFSLSYEKVIVTVPISILKSGGIEFVPALPATKVTALSTMEMDPSLRVLLDFKANFWGESSGFLYGASEAPEYFNAGVGRSDMGARTLAVTLSGSKALAYSSMGRNMIPLLIAELDALFAGKATNHIRYDPSDNMVAVIQDWTTEPFIKGGISYSKPGGTNQHRKDLAASLSKKLFFAGEATDYTGEFGTINGALLSAERAVAEVIGA